MKSSEIKESFLNYFEKNGHKRVRSSSLVPSNDPTLFFTNAGMVQFKEVFLGAETRDYVRATTSQKCMRVSGKHNDLENVGHTPRHHTFFEMLGNFSFGDYFKKDAIAFAWEYLTKEIGLDKKRLWITVFKKDDEAEKLWQKHVSKDRIFRLGEKDNFWTMGDTGPCGPCSEIIWDFGSGSFDPAELDSLRFMEIWNLVFMQYNRNGKGEMTPLSAPSIDTGMGLERLATVIQNKRSNWENDLFSGLISEIKNIIGAKKKLTSDDEIALKVIADHSRGMTFLIADGILPSNEGRGYVLRRIMRRAIRYSKKFGQHKPYLSKVSHLVIDEMGSIYPELVQHQHFIEKVISSEEERFLETLDKGLDILQGEFQKLKDKNRVLPGDIVFKLYDTFGFPKDLTEIIALENSFTLDNSGFDELMNSQKKRAKASWKGSGGEAVSAVYKELISKGITSNFIGYETESTTAKVLAILKDNQIVKNAEEGEKVQLVTDKTPFYGESGGQIGDIGIALADGIEVEILDTKKPLSDLIAHVGIVKKGSIKIGQKITLAIDSERRQDIRCNHTATHLLHKTLREVLGEHVKQAGSLVDPDHLRFDFSHFEGLTKEQIAEIESRVNAAVRRNFKLNIETLPYEEAIQRGALAFFGEKYGDVVRMVEIIGYSVELCGGTHLKYTGEIGIFKIISESSISAGVRRIEAITGRGAEKHLNALETELNDLANILKTSRKELVLRAGKIVDHLSKTEKELRNLQMNQSSEKEDWKLKIIEIKGIKTYIDLIEILDRKMLGVIAEERLKNLQSGIVLLASKLDDNVVIVGAGSKDITQQGIHIGDIVKQISEEFSGKGGGRPDFAQGGGKAVEKLEHFKEIVLLKLNNILKK